MSAHIYLMHLPGTRLYKIGVYVCPEARLRTLRAIYGSRLRLLFSSLLNDPKAAERMWHRGPVWMIPESDLKGFEPPKRTGRPPKSNNAKVDNKKSNKR